MTQRKKSAHRLLSWVLVLVMVCGLFYAVPVYAQTADTMEFTDSTEPIEPTVPTEPLRLTLEELMEKFPEGKYWNGGDPDSWTETPCTHHGRCGTYGWDGWCGCNSFNGQSIQCMGFADKLGYDATGLSPREYGNGWKEKSSVSALNSLKAGDIVRRNGHSMYVTAVNGNTVTVADCNAINKSCNIRWGVTVTKSNLSNNFEYVRSAPVELVLGYLGKCEEHPASGSVMVTADTMLRTHPCSQEAYEKSSDISPVCGGTELKVFAVSKNTEGQYWYKTVWNDQTCYVPAEYADDFTSDYGTVTVTDVSAPANTRKGKGYSIKGAVSSDTLPLTCVGAYVFEGSTVTETPYLSSEDGAINKLTYSIGGSAVDNNLKFGSLPVGDYTYLLTATVTNYSVSGGNLVSEDFSVKLHQNTFTVSSSTPHTHSFGETAIMGKSCIEDCVITFTCTRCAFSYTQTVFAVGEHTMGQWETAEQANCTQAGLATRKCVCCDFVDTMILPVTDMHPNEKTVYTAPTCTEQGYNGIFCADCGIELGREDHEAPLEHCYCDWVVTKPATLACAGERQQSCNQCGYVVTEELPCLAGSVESWGLTLGSDLNINFQLHIDAQIRGTASVVITVDDEIFRYRVSEARRNASDDTYRVTVPVAAAQMGDTIQVQVINGEDATQTAEYTVLQYAQSILSNPEFSDYHPLIREMLHYGAAAQQYFDHNTERLVDSGIEKMDAQDIPETWPENVTVSGKADSVQFYGASLVYREKIAVRYYFRISGVAEENVFRCGENVYTPTEKDGLWYIEIPDICIQDLDAVVILSVNDSLWITYSPVNYIVRMNQKGTDAAKALVKAMYNYYLAAEAYMQSYA